MHFSTLSAIVRGSWLLNKEWAATQQPIVNNLREGKGFEFDKRAIVNEKVSTPYAASTYIQRVSPYTRTEMLPMGSIVLVNISGPILKSGDYCSYGSVDYSNMMYKLADASNVSGVILDIDSPGGQADGTAMFAQAITELKSKKPVIAHINDGMAASAAMWIASAATEIYGSQPTDQFGSVGVYTSVADWNKYYAAQGLDVHDVYAPQSTEKNLPYKEAIQKGNDSLLEADLKVLCDQFIKTISTNRKGKIQGDSWKGGKLFYAAEAKSIGLIDGTKSFSQVVNRMNSLIKSRQQSNSNNMAFENALVAAKATSFEVTDGGFLLSEDQLNNLEAAVIAGNTSSTELTASLQKVAGLETTNGELTTQLQTSADAVATLNTELQANAGTIASLNETITKLKGEPSGSGSKLKATDDTATGDEKKVPSYLSDADPANQYADKHLPKARK